MNDGVWTECICGKLTFGYNVFGMVDSDGLLFVVVDGGGGVPTACTRCDVVLFSHESSNVDFGLEPNFSQKLR